MDNRQTICLLNDSFPPVIDGVANAVKNYAEIIHQAGQDTLVITPSHPDSDDTVFPYPVVRYPSLDFRKVTGGYTAGIPFSPAITRQLGGRKVALLHSHCPVVSTILGRELRRVVDAPLVMTYHTKFDIEINKMVKGRALKAGTMKALVQNVSACNEVWAVSAGAADNLRSMGYEGECVVMPNGVDLPLGRVSQEAIDRAIAGYDLPQGVPLFLFVGRIMWYKGLKIIADAWPCRRPAERIFAWCSSAPARSRRTSRPISAAAALGISASSPGRSGTGRRCGPGTAGRTCFSSLPPLIPTVWWSGRRRPAPWAQC